MSQTTTKVETFTEIEVEAHCHIIGIVGMIQDPTTLCGVPIIEQCCTGSAEIVANGYYAKFEYCPCCGLKQCPKCRRLDV